MEKKFKFFIKPFSFLIFFFLWEIIAFIINDALFPSLFIILKILFFEIKDGELFYHLSITLYRVLVSFSLALFLGGLIGILMGNSKRLNQFLDGWNILFLNVPALVLIILSYVWFGLTELAAILAVCLNKIPNVVVTVREGAKSIDRKLLEIAYIYKLSKPTMFFKFYLPQLYPYLIAAARSGISLIWKIVLVVELLGRSNGIGFKLHEYFQFFDIASILAYTLAFVIVMILIEKIIFQPLDNRANRWR